MTKTFFSISSQTFTSFVSNFDSIDLKFKKISNFKKSSKQSLNNKIRIILLSDNSVDLNSFYHLLQLLHLEWNLSQRFLQNLNHFLVNSLFSNNLKIIESTLCKKSYFRFLDNNVNSLFLDSAIETIITTNTKYCIQFSTSNFNNLNPLLSSFVVDSKIIENSRIQLEFSDISFRSIMNIFPQISHKLN